MTMWLNECNPSGVWTNDPKDPEIYGIKPHGSKTNVWDDITLQGTCQNPEKRKVISMNSSQIVTIGRKIVVVSTKQKLLKILLTKDWI